MSSFAKLTKHPKTGEWEEANWIDNYFGGHHYGVMFSDGYVADPDKEKLETKNED